MPPTFFGLLAHSHGWSSADEVVEEKITELLAEREVDLPPRLGIDLVCVADLNCWSRMTTTTSMAVAKNMATMGVNIEPGVGTGMIRVADLSDKGSRSSLMPPISVLISSLLIKLATNDSAIRSIADGLRVTGTSGSGRGQLNNWSLSDVLDERVHQQLDARLDTDADWQMAYM